MMRERESRKMELVNVRDLFRRQDEYVDQTIAIGGWVRNIRNSKNFGFIVVNDGTFFEPVQVVYSDVLENFEEVEKLNVGAAIIVTGKLVATPGTKQPFEIQAEKVEVEGPSTPDYPLQKKRHSFEYLRTISHLRPRTNTFEAVFRVRSLCAYAIHKFFQERDFVYVHTPLITGSDCEGAGEMFQVTTLDMNDLPMTEDGKVDIAETMKIWLQIYDEADPIEKPKVSHILMTDIFESIYSENPEIMKKVTFLFTFDLNKNICLSTKVCQEGYSEKEMKTSYESLKKVEIEGPVPILTDVQMVDGKLIYSLNGWVGKTKEEVLKDIQTNFSQCAVLEF